MQCLEAMLVSGIVLKEVCHRRCLSAAYIVHHIITPLANLAENKNLMGDSEHFISQIYVD